MLVVCFDLDTLTFTPFPHQLTGAAGNLAVINGVLQTANSIFKRYRDQYRSNALVSELAQTQVCVRARGEGCMMWGQGGGAHGLVGVT